MDYIPQAGATGANSRRGRVDSGEKQGADASPWSPVACGLRVREEVRGSGLPGRAGEGWAHANARGGGLEGEQPVGAEHLADGRRPLGSGRWGAEVVRAFREGSVRAGACVGLGAGQ